MTPEKEQQAELTLVLMLHKMPSRKVKKSMCRRLSVDWAEYQHLKQKYSRLLEKYDKITSSADREKIQETLKENHEKANGLA